MDEVKLYQSEIKQLLENLILDRNTPVSLEWRAMDGEGPMYCPRVDIAIGPFAIERRLEREYDRLMDYYQEFFFKLIDFHIRNLHMYSGEELNRGRNEIFRQNIFDDLKQKNQNARCLAVIEIENKVSRKHLIGGIVNACALGRIGIVVAWSPEKLRAFVKCRNYFAFLRSVGKNTYDTTNLLIIDKNQLLESLR